MSFVILKTFFDRIEKLKLLDIKTDMFHDMIQYQLVKDELKPDVFSVQGFERPPMMEIPEYREKFHSTLD